MPASLLDMFQPQNVAGEPVGFGDALTGHSNSLVGLGMGLLSPYRPGESPYAAALQGYQAGSVADSRRGYQQAQLQHQKRQEAFQRSQARQTQENWEKQFARSGESDFAKIARDLNLQPGTPEYGEQARRYLQSKLEGDWSVQTDEDTGQKFAYNKRTNETKPISVPGQTGTAAAPAPAINWAPDASNAPVYGAGQGGYSQPPASPPVATSTAVPDEAVPPAPPGSDRKEWKKEQTKLLVQRRIAAEAAKKAGASIDPVSEDIDRSIAQISKYPGMTTGGFSSILKKIPLVGGSTQAGEVESLINTVKASSSLEKLQQMRAQSPTGASGLGAVTQGEHALLQNAIGSLDQSQDAASVLYNLERIKRIRHEIIHGPGTAPLPQFAPPSYQQAAPTAPASGKPPPPRPGFVKGGYVFKGGNPADEANWAPVR